MDDQQQWRRDGHLVLRGAVAEGAIDAYRQDLARVREGLLVRAPGDEHASLAVHAAPGTAGAVDPYAISDAARTLLLPSALITTLTARWDGEPPLLFDATEAIAGAPDPGPYRDATYVAVSEPGVLAVAVVALGATDVALYPGSQEIETTLFSGRHRHVNPERDDEGALQRHRDEVAAALADLEPATIALAPGDVLLLDGDLIHAPVAGDALVAHLCPQRAQPSWFAYRPERARRAAIADGTAWITSQHYDLVDALEPETADDDLETAREIETVEDALRAHDDTPTPPPPSPTTNRRSGGLVNGVRGMMRRGRR